MESRGASEITSGAEQDAFNYKKNLIGDVRFLSEEEKKSVEHIEQELYRVQAELRSVAHERVVIDVLSRPVLTEIEHHRGMRVQAAKEAYLQRRSGVEPPSSSSTRHAHRGTGSSPEDPIFIPPYVPPHMRGLKPSQQMAYAAGGSSRLFGGGGAGAAVSLENIAVRATGSTTMVPSMRQGYFPPEYKNLRITPTDVAHGPKESTKTTKKKKKKAVSFEPLARSLQSKLLTTSQEMKRLKDRLTKTDNKFNKERLKSSKKLKLILDALEEKQVWKDHALMAAVEQLIQETLESFQDVVDEVDLLQILEEIVAQIPQPFMYEVPMPAAPFPPPPDASWEEHMSMAPPPSHTAAPPHEENVEETYTIINVQKKPSIIRLPEPPQTTEIEVQTDHTEEEDDDVPPPPPPPPQPPVVVEVTKSSVEKDLLAIMDTIVASNKAAMQGQQAIMLALVQELADKAAVPPPEPQVIIMPAAPKAPPAPVKEDKVVDTADLLPEPAPVLVAPPEEIAEPAAPSTSVIEDTTPPLPPYRTAFGDVVLGGKTLTGPYAAPPKVTLPQALAQAGLDEYGEVIAEKELRAKFDAPVQRRAMPLTMMLLNRPTPTPPSPPTPTVSPLQPQDFMDFAQKLLTTVSNAHKTPDTTMNREEVMKAVQEGVKVGVRSALGYWEDDVEDDYRRGYRPLGTLQHTAPVHTTGRRGFPLHQLTEREEVPGRRVLREAEDDPLNLRQIRQAQEESRQRTQAMLRERRETGRDNDSHYGDGGAFDDMMSLAEEDEEFHALYGDRSDLSRSLSFTGGTGGRGGGRSGADHSMDTSDDATFAAFDDDEEEDGEAGSDRRFLRQAAKYRHDPLHHRNAHRRGGDSSVGGVSTANRRAVPVLRCRHVMEDHDHDDVPRRDNKRTEQAVAEAEEDSDRDRWTEGDSSFLDQSKHRSTQRKSPSSRRLAASSMNTTGDDHEDDDEGADAGSQYLHGLPPLVSSVLPHHASRQVKSTGLYQTPRALVGRQATSSWASGTSSVGGSMASSDISVSRDGDDHRRHSAAQPRLRRSDRDPSSNGATGFSRIQARTKPRSGGSASSSWASSASVSSSPLNATRTTDQSSTADPMDGRKERAQAQPTTVDSHDESQQHWSDDSSEPSVPSSTGGRLLVARGHHQHQHEHRHRRQPHHSHHRSDVDEEDDASEDPLGARATAGDAARDSRDAREDIEHSIASPHVSLDSSTSSLYSFDTSRSDVSIGRHVHIPLLSVGQMAAKQGRPRWNV